MDAPGMDRFERRDDSMWTPAAAGLWGRVGKGFGRPNDQNESGEKTK
jgi:hypothetical protein